MPEFSNPDTAVPIIIIGVSLMLMIATWAFTRGKTPTRSTTKSTTDVPATPAPIVGQTKVTQAHLGIWHRAHGDAVKRWIENHEKVLKQVSEGGMAIDLNADLMASHELLGPEIDDAIAKHPAPQMRAQLSALVLASRNTIDSLRRSNWTNAEKEHIAYLEYRDTWLDRLRQFTTAESQVKDLRSIGNNDALPDWPDRKDSPAG